MAAFPMWLLVAAALVGQVSGRLGNAEVVEVPSFFGEASVMQVNAASNTEASEAPKLPILLTQASPQNFGAPVKEEETAQPVATRDSNGDLEKVCERTRTALSAQADGPEKPRGPVYKECMAGLAPISSLQQDSDAVDTLSDCMALVNALVASKNGDCHSAVGVMEASRRPPPPPATAAPAPLPPTVPPTVAPAPKPRVNAVVDVKKQEEEALDLVSEAMTTVCSETVRDAEIGIKSEKDAFKLSNTIAPICQDSAVKHLGAAAAMSSLTKEWCRQLDGRLTMALETGFFFALAPVEAERQATEANPYASTTRRKFCTRFINSLRHQAKDGGLYLGGAPKPTAQPAQAAPALLVPPVPVAAIAAVATAPLPTLPPAPPAPVQEAAPQPTQPVAAADVAKSPPMPTPKGAGLDMLRLVQALSARNEWNQACTGLISRLTSEEGSVTEEYALGAHETADGTKVLTFNAADQGQVRKCAAQLKVVAIQQNAFQDSPSAGSPTNGVSFIATGASLTSADEAQAIIDSPWAADACDDIAHGFLTARLAHPSLAVAEFCPLYARDLQAMHAGVPPAEQAKQDLDKLRKRGGLKRRMATQATAAQALNAPQPALRAQAKKSPSAALITENTSNEEQEGADFWAGLLQG